MTDDILKLEKQLCFPLYACARAVIRRYKPLLDGIGLTYTQYIAMMVMWEMKTVNIKTLGEHLYLDSGTLTPLVKKLESDGLVTRERSHADERNLVVSLTAKGEELRERAVKIPGEMGSCIPLQPDEAAELYRLLNKILKEF